jgi:hypothetical protein
MDTDMTDSNPCDPIKAAFEAAGIGVPNPSAEISFKEGCIRMGFHYRQNFKIALKHQQRMDALGENIAGARLPEPHWKGDAQRFYLRDVEAFTAGTQSE